MRVPTRLSRSLGALLALTLLCSSGSASAALIHDIFLRDELAGFIEFSTENHTDAGAAITGFELELTVISFDLTHINQNPATWTIDPNTWVLTDGFLSIVNVTCASGETLFRQEFRYSSPGTATNTRTTGFASCNLGSIRQDTRDLTFEPRDIFALPEPSALLLLGSGLAGMAMWRRRTKHSNQA